jgi:acetyl-CoA C-acetyltransferase
VIDPRTPVLVGAAQRSWREGDTDPVDAMTATTLAMTDAEPAVAALLRQATSVRALGGMWRYRDPARLVAADIGVPAARTAITPIGGNEVYDLVTTTAEQIMSGALEVAVICAAETMRTTRRAKRERREVARRQELADPAADDRFGSDLRLVDDAQVAAGAADPIVFYAMAESALRHAAGESAGTHRDRIAALWATASVVAADNPHAWSRDAVTADEVATPGPTNRMVAEPYTKLMTSNVDVDQSAAVLVCSYGAAVAAGVDPASIVHLVAGTGAVDHWILEERWALPESPAMRIAGRAGLELAGWTIDDVDDLDLYSCFPAAVQVAQQELGIDPRRPFTITGGLTFAGGPFNSYCLHALATAHARIRAGRSRNAFLSGNGGYFTKHSFLALAATAPEAFRSTRPQGEVDRLPRRPRPAASVDAATIEAVTVLHDRDGTATRAIASTLAADGARRWATTSDLSSIDELRSTGPIGTTVRLHPGDQGTYEIVGFDGSG